LKIDGSFTGFNISAKGLSMQRKKMDMIAENIANADVVRNESGQPYQRKFLSVKQDQNNFQNTIKLENQSIRLSSTNNRHMSPLNINLPAANNTRSGMKHEEITDNRTGEIIFMPDHPDADEKGYVQMSNVNIITEMVDMIAASRSYEANLTALNSSKQIAKDSLEI
jgi:flagellar basal-body rod protein FlgC